jgi:hypothetical protein
LLVSAREDSVIAGGFCRPEMTETCLDKRMLRRLVVTAGSQGHKCTWGAWPQARVIDTPPKYVLKWTMMRLITSELGWRSEE